MELKQLRWKAKCRFAGLAATLALGAGWSASAFSATTTSVECDDLIRDLRSLEVPAATFSVTPVEHVSIEPIPSDIELLDAQSASSETAAPFLFLTPRVASVLRDIFEVSQELGAKDEVSEPASSPFADSERVPSIKKLTCRDSSNGCSELISDCVREPCGFSG